MGELRIGLREYFTFYNGESSYQRTVQTCLRALLAALNNRRYGSHIAAQGLGQGDVIVQLG